MLIQPTLPQLLSKDFFIRTAIENYDSVCCSNEEFLEDLKRILYLKKLFSRYVKHNDLKDRLIINHLVILCNCFNEKASLLLFLKIPKDYWNILATFLVFLNRMPNYIPEIGIRLSDFKLDNNIIGILRKI